MTPAEQIEYAAELLRLAARRLQALGAYDSSVMRLRDIANDAEDEGMVLPERLVDDGTRCCYDCLHKRSEVQVLPVGDGKYEKADTYCGAASALHCPVADAGGFGSLPPIPDFLRRQAE